jgi:hypothetical protein
MEVPQQVDHSLSLVFEVDGARYVAWPTEQVNGNPVRTSRCPADSEQLVPDVHIEDHALVTLVDIPSNQPITRAWLEDILERYVREDDVITPGFFGTVLVRSGAGVESKEVQTKWGINKVYPIHLGDTPPGPYIVYDGCLWGRRKIVRRRPASIRCTLRQKQNRK